MFCSNEPKNASKLIERIKTQPGYQAIELDYDRDNIAAAWLYMSCGFQPVEENEDGKILARMVVTRR